MNLAQRSHGFSHKIMIFTLAVFFNLGLHAQQIDCSTISPYYTGYCYEYHPNKKIAMIKEYKQGTAVGIWMKFNTKGELIEQINASDLKTEDKTVPEIKFVEPLVTEFNSMDGIDSDEGPITIEMPVKNKVDDENQVYEFVEEIAEFPGGIQKMKDWIKANLKYPQKAIDNGLTGKVFLKFMVDKDGSISTIKVMRGIPDCPECDQEAIRVIANMPKWKPAINQGKIVKSYFFIPIQFKLE